MSSPLVCIKSLAKSVSPFLYLADIFDQTLI
jgi:hypothetical protein